MAAAVGTYIVGKAISELPPSDPADPPVAPPLGVGLIRFQPLPPDDPSGPPLASALEQYQASNLGGRASLINWAQNHPDDKKWGNDIAWELSIRRVDPILALWVARRNEKSNPTAITLDTLAQAYLVNSRRQDALNASARALQVIAPDDTPVLFTLYLRQGWIFAYMGQIPAAIQNYRKAENLNTESYPFEMAHVWRGLGFAMTQNREWDEAVQYLTQYREKYPEDLEAQANLGNALLEIKPPQLDEAEAHLQAVLDAGNGWEAWYFPYLCMMDAKAKRGDFAAAVEWCQKGVRYFTRESAGSLKTEPSLEPCRLPILKILLQNGLMEKEEYDAVARSQSPPAAPIPSIVHSMQPVPQLDFRALLAQKEAAALPYFISFHSGEAKPLAERLKEELGNDGFMSAHSLSAGDEWCRQLARHLKKAKTLLMLETAAYHTRPYCRIEYAYAIASGMRILRVGLCPPEELDGDLRYLTALQYEVFGGPQDADHIVTNVLRRNLPAPVKGLDLRKNAAFELVKSLNPGQIEELAVRLSIDDQVLGKTRNTAVKSSLLRLAFQTEAKADKFGEAFDLNWIL